MPQKIRELRSLVYAKYDAESDLACALGWSRQRLNRITNGEKVPNVEELNQIASALDVPIGELALIFLNKKSQKCDTGGKVV